MNTPSHLIMTAALRKRFRHLPIDGRAMLLGSVAPDLALIGLSIGGGLYYQRVRGLSPAATFRHMYDTMYFEDPVWIALHNLLHGPTLLLIWLALLWRFRWDVTTRTRRWARWVFWLLCGCLLHSVVDILTHVDDGPLLLFPFEWTIRFQSAVSYWDRRHYGAQFAIFELVLNLALLGYLLLPWLARRLPRRASAPRTNAVAGTAPQPLRPAERPDPADTP